VVFLTDLRCPRCKRSVKSDAYAPGPGGRPPAAVSYETCLRRCEICGIGFANARGASEDDVTLIYENPLENIPAEVRAGAAETIMLASNSTHRLDKWGDFGDTLLNLIPMRVKVVVEPGDFGDTLLNLIPMRVKVVVEPEPRAERGRLQTPSTIPDCPIAHAIGD